MINLKKHDPVADAVKDILQQEALKGSQHKIDKNKNNKVDAGDFAILRGEKEAVKKEEVEIVYEANIEPTSAKSRSHISNLSNPTVNSVTHQGKQIGLITKQSDGSFHAHHSAAKLAHAESGTFPTRDGAHQFIRNAHAKAIKNGTLKEEFEQIDELSKSTLGSYVKKAAKDTAVQGFAIGDSIANKKWSTGAKAGDMANKRIKGIGSATDRLTKEEQETVEESIGGIAKRFGSALKKGVKAVDRVVTGGDKEDLIKLTQKQAGVPQTGKKPEPQKEEVQVSTQKTLRQFREGWDEMMASVKKRAETQPNGGAGKKEGSRYGGSKQKEKPEQESDSKK